MKLGADHSKAGEIANKLGMSAAEYNHIMNVNEDSTMPSLSEIVSSINTSK
jgi:DNA-directed RNA polymerase specialized sigma subunit